MKMVMIHDLVEENGKTIKENNLALNHNIPIGTLVEVAFCSWLGNGACEKIQARLWVISHDRDCDGTPLYTVSQWDDPVFAMSHLVIGQAHRGLSEQSLTPVKVTQKISDGYDLPEWWDEEDE